MKLSKKIIPSLIAASLMMSFVACSSSNDGETTTPNVTFSATGTVIDGYISGAIACLDLSLNDICDSDEPLGETNATGVFSLNITPTHQAHTNYANAPIIMSGGKDVDTQKDFIGTMKTSLTNGGQDMIVTPLSTMVRALVDNNATQAEAEAAVATVFGINVEDVLKDPVAEFNAGNKDLAKVTLTIQKTLEVLAKANGNEDTATVYSQLASSVLSVSASNTTTGMTEVITQALSSLTGGAASVEVNTITLLENAIKDANATTLQDQALIIDAQVNVIKADPTATITATTIDADTFNTKDILIKNKLNQLGATDVQKETALALSDIVSLINDTAKTTSDASDKILGNIFRQDSSLDSLTKQLIDVIAPVLTLKGTSTVTITAGTTYIESGATALDNIDGSLTVDISGNVDTATVGTYTLTYTATDTSSNESTLTRTVIVVEEVIADIIPPVISLNGASSISLTFATSYTEAGATAIDNIDGDLTVVITGSVDTNKAGTYTLTYTATDVASNTSTLTRTVTVEEEVITASPTSDADLKAAVAGSSCIDSNGDTGVVSQTQDPFGNVSSATCAAPTSTLTPTSDADLKASSVGTSCIDANGVTGVVSQTQDPFGNVSSATCAAS